MNFKLSFLFTFLSLIDLFTSKSDKNFRNNNRTKSILIGPFQFINDKNDLSLEDCGLSNFDRIANGQNTDDGSYPFMALVYFKHRPIGAAVIISERWLLSVAHNFKRLVNTRDFTIGVGSNYVTKLRTYSLKQVIIHQNFSDHINDIALIKLKKPLNFGETIRPICLPEFPFEPVNSKQIRVIGFGYKNFNARKISNILQKVDLELISLERCNEMYSLLRRSIGRSLLCTFNLGKDACIGDSGGPAFVYQNGRAVLFGLVSFGVTCADQFPGVYTAVSYHLPWIQDQLSKNE